MALLKAFSGVILVPMERTELLRKCLSDLMQTVPYYMREAKTGILSAGYIYIPGYGW